MPAWEQIDDGAFNGVRKYLRGLEDGSVDVRHEFLDDSSIIDANKASQVATMNTRMGEMEKAASIPAKVIYEWIEKHGVNAFNPHHADGVAKLLNSSDYRYLKCRDIII
jgi:hypothetical protein